MSVSCSKELFFVVLITSRSCTMRRVMLRLIGLFCGVMEGRVVMDVVRNCEAPLHADEVDFGFADFGPEGYKRFVFEEYQALNRLTADELVALTAEAGFAVVRQERRHYEPSSVPDVLLEKYGRDVLVNNEIFLLLQRK